MVLARLLHLGLGEVALAQDVVALLGDGLELLFVLLAGLADLGGELRLLAGEGVTLLVDGVERLLVVARQRLDLALVIAGERADLGRSDPRAPGRAGR